MSALIGAAAIGALGSLLGSAMSNDESSSQSYLARKWQSGENVLNRNWQSEENQKSRDWNERMWNLQNQYNTPSAMMKRYSDAGLNPFLVGGSSPTVGAAGSAGSPSMGSPSMVGAPNVPNIRPLDFGSPFSAILQAKSVDANAAAANSQASKDMISALAQAYKELGSKGFNEFAKKVAPFLQSINPDDSYWSKHMKSTIYNTDMDSLNKDLQYELAKKYSPEQIQTGIQEANYRISEIVGRLNSMRVQNQALIDKTAAEIVRIGCDAFRLKKEGEKFVADTQTANALRQWLVKTTENEARIRGAVADRHEAENARDSVLFFNWSTNKEDKDNIYNRWRIPNTRYADPIWTSVDKFFGDYVKVMGSPSSTGGNSNTTYYSY